MKNILCIGIGGPNRMKGAPKKSHFIELRQHGKDNFSVRHGVSVEKNLNYALAAKELGESIMHMLACDGDLDPRKRNER